MDLSKFSKDDLKKTASEISEYLKKAAETDYDPDATVDHGTHEEEKLGGTPKDIVKPAVSGGGEAAKSADVKKDDYNGGNGDMMNGNGGEGMTEGSENQVLMQILEILQEIREKLVTPAAPAPTPEIKASATPPAPVTTPATATGTEVIPPKGDININVTKSLVEDVLKEMGITKSATTQKPKQETGHPIEKTGGVTYDQIKKMSWDEVYNADVEMRGNKTHY